MNTARDLNHILRFLDSFLGAGQFRYTFCFNIVDNCQLFLAFRIINNFSGGLNFDWRANRSHLELYRYNLTTCEFELGLSPLTKIDESGRRLSLEDPRMTISNGEIDLICCCWGVNQVPYQTVFKLSDQLELKSWQIPQFKGNGSKRTEKNWVPFSGSSDYLYSLSPDVITLSSAWVELERFSGLGNDFGEPHCGSNLVFYRGYWIGFWHASVRTSEKISLYQYPSKYTLGVFALKIDDKIMTLRSKEVGELLPNQPFDRFYPGSALIKVCFAFQIMETEVIIGLGVNDCFCKFEVISTQRWDKFLDDLIQD